MLWSLEGLASHCPYFCGISSCWFQPYDKRDEQPAFFLYTMAVWHLYLFVIIIIIIIIIIIWKTHHTKHRWPLRERLPLSATIHFNSVLQCGRCFEYLHPHNPRGWSVAVPAFVLVFSLVFRLRDLYYRGQKIMIIERLRLGWHKPKLRGHTTNFRRKTLGNVTEIWWMRRNTLYTASWRLHGCEIHDLTWSLTVVKLSIEWARLIAFVSHERRLPLYLTDYRVNLICVQMQPCWDTTA